MAKEKPPIENMPAARGLDEKVPQDDTYELIKEKFPLVLDTYSNLPEELKNELSKLKKHSSQYFLHTVEVSNFASIISNSEMLTPEELAEEEKVAVKISCLLHDIGKNKINKEILEKTDEFTEEEWQEITNHILYSYEMVKKYPELKDVAEIIRCHHIIQERPYPADCQNTKLKKLIRITALLDQYNSVFEKRPYNKNKDIEKSYAGLKEKFSLPIEKKIIKLLDQNRSKINHF